MYLTRVVCRQLKLEGSNQKYLRNSPDFFNISLHHDAELSSLPVMFINVDCDGTESSLLDCPRQVVNNNECLHDEDAGVICSRPDVTTGAMTTDAMTTYVMTTDAMTTDAMTTDAMTTDAMMEDVVTTEKPSHVDTGGLCVYHVCTLCTLRSMFVKYSYFHTSGPKDMRVFTV